MSFMIWRPGSQTDGICKVLDVQNIEDSFELLTGVSRLAGWPEDALCAMDPSFPKDIELADSLFGAGVLLISGKVRGLLEGLGVNRVEFLPVRIVNHKGRTASKDYFIANPLDICDCIDEQQSETKRNPIAPECILKSKRLVLQDDKVPADHKVFRPELWRDLVLVRRELAEAMNAANLSGLRFVEPLKYKGYG